MPTLNYPALLLALGMLESGNDDMAVGKAGERGRYQIKQEVWEGSTSLMPFRMAPSKTCSDQVAVQTLKARLAAFKASHRREPTIQQCYILWNAPSKVDRPSKKVRERAERFENLYNKYVKEKP